MQRRLVWVVGCLVGMGGCGPTPSPTAAPPADDAVPRVTSNLLREDYAGSDACAGCHTAIHQRWAASPMHRMTRLADRTEIHAPFAGQVFEFMGDRATLSVADGQRFMALRMSDRPSALYRITKVIGGRYREDFAGEPVARPTADAPALGPERILPVSFVLGRREWRYKGYSVLVPERPGLRPGSQWDRTCIFCHNTPPGIVRLYDELLGPGAPSYQGSTHGNLLPPARRWHYGVRDPAALRAAIDDELRVLGVSKPAAERSAHEALGQALRTTRQRFGESHLVEVGIGCEACHWGSAQHARDPHVLPSYLPTHPALRVEASPGRPAPSRSEQINRGCAQCHAVLFSRYPHTWEGGSRRGNPGGSQLSSGEARDYLLGGCAGELACTSCHDPHAEDDPQRLQQLATPAGNGVCLGCHQQLQTREALRAHTHHDPEGPGAACVACHMPRKNLGLGYDLTRYHRIGSPTEPARVLGDRPLECALCHTERSVSALIDDMERWWGRRYDRGALQALYGSDLDVDPLLVTLERGKAHEQGVAIALLGETRRHEALQRLVEQLAHPYPLLRYFTREALERIVDRPLPVDMSLPGEELRRAGHQWLHD